MFQTLISTIEGEQGRKDADWTPLKVLIATGGIAVCAAVLVWLSWMYWPVLAPLLPRAAGALMGLITKLGNFLRQMLPEIATLALAMVGVGMASKHIEQPQSQ